MNENALRQVIECLDELADVEFQQRVWVRGEGPEVSSDPLAGSDSVVTGRATQAYLTRHTAHRA
jgi:hypothetical protein